MKVFKLFTASVLLAIGVYAQSIDEHIAAIEAASGEERVKLMNEFKSRVFTMSDEQRASAIEQLRSSMQKKTRYSQQDTQNQMQNMDKAHMTQMDNMQDMHMSQHMNQQQAASQAVGEGIINGMGHSFQDGSKDGFGNFMGRH